VAQDKLLSNCQKQLYYIVSKPDNEIRFLRQIKVLIKYYSIICL